MPIDMRTLLLLAALFWFGPLAAQATPMVAGAPPHGSECPQAKRPASKPERPKAKPAQQPGGGVAIGATLFSRRPPEIFP